MKPVRTKTTNCILKSNADNVVDLPVTRIKYGDGVIAVESCWELSPEEIKKVSETGKLYFLCLGSTHAPILPKVEPEIEEE